MEGSLSDHLYDLTAFMNEQDFLQQIASTEALYAAAQHRMRMAKRVWVEAESLAIEHKISLERLRERLRMHKNMTRDYAPTLREQEIEGFRQRMSGVLKKV